MHAAWMARVNSTVWNCIQLLQRSNVCILARGGNFTRHAAEYIGMILLATVGLMLLVGTEELLMIFIGLELTGFTCVCIAFFLNTGAYYGEILRAGIESVPGGQIDAARSTGLGRLQTQLYVVLPQAVRNVLPDLLSNTLEVIKLTSLGSVVAMPELLFQARQAQSVTYNPTPIVLAALVYFVMLWPLVRLLSRLENRAVARM